MTSLVTSSVTPFITPSSASASTSASSKASPNTNTEPSSYPATSSTAAASATTETDAPIVVISAYSSVKVRDRVVIPSSKESRTSLASQRGRDSSTA
ncbi:hypothetical protein PMG11_06336 [Penicillium brasilianum]|uniref:Uncharacterized protein n=1 Tax=Penicillium brasilianum TaxID=104259 RepID=A0A0F7TQC6_PENBI|nr:hypothetical protein PMG11_06336 [Penicillium brasilianum]